MAMQGNYDVVVVGGSVAGCTAAVLYARQGLRVALLEQHADPGHYKKFCTHFLQPMAVPTIRKLGLEGPLEAAGALRSRLELWTRWGRIRAEAGRVPHGYIVRRQTLDPLLRGLAGETRGVESFPGTVVRGLLWDGAGRVCGVTADGGGEFKARLVVAADGRLSGLARLAGVEAHQDANHRFSYFTYYRGLPLRTDANAQYWHLGSDLAFAFRCDGGVTLLGLFQPLREWPVFKADPAGNFRRFWEGLPDAPRIGEAEPDCPLRGYAELPNQWRPAAVPGLAFVGDAALVLDPIWGTGCGFAFLSADWLVEATLPALGSGRDAPAALDRALRRYRKVHRGRTRWHYRLIAGFSRIRPDNLVERLVFSGATRDAELARRALTYLGRTVGPLSLGSPSTLGRAALVNLRHLLFGRKSSPLLSPAAPGRSQPATTS